MKSRIVLAVVLAGVAVIGAAGLAPLQRGRTVWELDEDVRVSLRQKGSRCRLSISRNGGMNVMDFVGPEDAAKPELLAAPSGEIWIRAKDRPGEAYAHFDPSGRVWRTWERGALDRLPPPGAEMVVVEPLWWAW